MNKTDFTYQHNFKLLYVGVIAIYLQGGATGPIFYAKHGATIECEDHTLYPPIFH